MMNSKKEDLLYASFFLFAVVYSFLIGGGDRFWLNSWGDFMPNFVLLFVLGRLLFRVLARVKGGEEGTKIGWSTCFSFLVFGILFIGELFFVGGFLINKLGWG